MGLLRSLIPSLKGGSRSKDSPHLTQKQKRRIREEKPGNGNSRESDVRESSETADSEYPSLVFYPNNNQILEFYCAYWSLFSRPASLSCLPGSRRKGAQKLEFFKKVEVKNIINYNFRKSSIQWRKTRRRNQKIGIVLYSSRKEEETWIKKKRSSSNHKWEGRASGKREQGDHSFCLQEVLWWRMWLSPRRWPWVVDCINSCPSEQDHRRESQVR